MAHVEIVTQQLQIDEVTKQLQQKAQTLKSLRGILASTENERKDYWRDLQLEIRQNKSLSSRLQELEERVLEAEGRATKSESEKRDLLRSLNRATDRLRKFEETQRHDASAISAKEAEKLAAVEQVQEIRTSVEILTRSQQGLAAQIQEERGKRWKLKQAARSRLERMEAEKTEWLAKEANHDAEIQKWANACQAGEERAKIAEADAMQFKVIAQRCEAIASDRQNERDELHRQVREIQSLNDRLTQELVGARSRIYELESAKQTSMKEWMLMHVQNLDAKLERKRAGLEEQNENADPKIGARAARSGTRSAGSSPKAAARQTSKGRSSKGKSNALRKSTEK